MEYIVTLKNQIAVEAPTKTIAAKRAARYLSQLLLGNEPENGDGFKLVWANFYCSPMEYTGGIEGQGANDARLSSLDLKKLNNKQ